MRRICVYCGSNRGARPDYAAAAENLAAVLVDRKLELVFGGSSKGIMGVLADEMLALGGRVQGVIPRQLVAKEVAHSGLTQQHVVDSTQTVTFCFSIETGSIAKEEGTRDSRSGRV